MENDYEVYNYRQLEKSDELRKRLYRRSIKNNILKHLPKLLKYEGCVIAYVAPYLILNIDTATSSYSASLLDKVFVILLLIGIVVFVCYLMIFMISRYGENLYLVDVTMINSGIETKHNDYEDKKIKQYYIRIKSEKIVDEDAIMQSYVDEGTVSVFKVDKHVYKQYEYNKKAYLAKWLDDGIDEIVDKDIIDKSYELLILK